MLPDAAGHVPASSAMLQPPALPSAPPPLLGLLGCLFLSLPACLPCLLPTPCPATPLTCAIFNSDATASSSAFASPSLASLAACSLAFLPASAINAACSSGDLSCTRHYHTCFVYTCSKLLEDHRFMRDAFWNVCKQLGSAVGRIVLHMTPPHMEGTSRLSCTQAAGECTGLRCTAFGGTLQW